MANYSVTANPAATYPPQSGAPADVVAHENDHGQINTLVNLFDRSMGSATSGQVPQWNGTGFAPAAIAAGGATPGIYRPEDYGAVGDGVADDGAAINSCFAAAIAGKGRAVLKGPYKSTVALVWNDPYPRIEGLAGGPTVITFTSNTIDFLTAGSGTQGNIGPSGYVRNLSLVGPTATPTSGKAGLKLNGVVQCTVENVRCDNQDIGFDLVNDCYGSSFHNIRTTFASCNVGVNLRSGANSGSDLSFYDAWLGGYVAAYHVSGGGGGYHVYGGQVGAGVNRTSASDTSGCIILGKDYLTGSVGEASFEAFGLSFEGADFVWCIRVYNMARAAFYGCAFNPTQSSAPAIGVLKVESGQNGHVSFYDSILSGYFSAAALISLAGTYGDYVLNEVGTYTAAQQPSINGTNVYVRSMAAQSNVTALPPRFAGSASATTLGTLSKKLQIFDPNGNSLGYIPLYTSIT